MPFIALDKQSNRRIHVIDALRSREYICQLCKRPMMIKDGKILQAHFAHYASCPSDYGSHPETEDHIVAKMRLAKWLKAEFPEYADAAIEYEVPIKEAKRIADLLVTGHGAWRDAHEVQLSSITTKELEARTNDYLRAGICVYWWLGKSARTPVNEIWCKRVFGRACTLEF